MKELDPAPPDFVGVTYQKDNKIYFRDMFGNVFPLASDELQNEATKLKEALRDVRHFLAIEGFFRRAEEIDRILGDRND